MTGQPFPGQQQIIFATQQQSSSIQQPQPMFAPYPPQAIIPINLDPKRQMVQYRPHPQQLNQLRVNNQLPTPHYRQVSFLH